MAAWGGERGWWGNEMEERERWKYRERKENIMEKNMEEEEEEEY